ncbi:hypothetical protein [Streptacidiphilus sp. EB103A]|uniref:hypothetical protein n=1 Tax=Streptacidiphilus sp. EB103A TaxID=3156275 RepID=UPI0035117E87
MERHRGPVADAGWRASARFAVRGALVCGVLFLGADLVAGGVTSGRAALAVGAACVLGLILWPARVTAGPGWLQVRWLWSVRRVDTGRLVLLRQLPGRAERMQLRDADGARVELDTEAVVGTPGLWLLLDRGVDASRRAGWLRRERVDAALLDRMGARAAECTLLGAAPPLPRPGVEEELDPHGS